MQVTFTYMIEVATGNEYEDVPHWQQEFDDKESALKWLKGRGYEQINKNSFKKQFMDNVFYVGTLIE